YHRAAAEICSDQSGADRDRTDDLLNAIQALSQLSYSPVTRKFRAAPPPRQWVFGRPGLAAGGDRVPQWGNCVPALGPGWAVMEIAVRGSVLVAAKVENLGDVLNCARGLFGPELIKSVQLSGVLVAPKTSCFALPTRVVKQLRLTRLGTRKART